jgi:hypothetical protein
MVRRGSAVRVRQRALEKPRKTAFFCQPYFQNVACGAGMEPFMEPSGSNVAFVTVKTAI